MSSKVDKALPKGYEIEELLRSYFLKSGYFVVRGVPFIYEGFDVTDIDLWLYSRTSSVSREVTIVDAKNKKTPQAIERIFWVQGLKLATKATSAIVATTDRRQEVTDFGRQLGIVVLDGSFLTRLAKSESLESQRITDEGFFSQISEYSLAKLDGDWKGRIKHCKSLLATPISFDTCNQWLSQGKFFAEQSVTKKGQQKVALRCLYLVCSFIAIGVDFSIREISFHEQNQRSKLITEGFTYGSRGSAGMKKVMDLTMGLVQEHVSDGPTLAHQIKGSIDKKLQSLKTGILGEFFSRNEVSKSLFSIAKEMEQLAMNKEFAHHKDASVELRSLLYCLIDYWGINRVIFSET
jgi:hypothetical protein